MGKSKRSRWHVLSVSYGLKDYLGGVTFSFIIYYVLIKGPRLSDVTMKLVDFCPAEMQIMSIL